jgi:4-hydroxy-tetrahydrodipicolinate synthase
MLKGSLVAIVTPMHDDGSLDLQRLRALVDWHIAEGSDGLVVVGTTGESPTVNYDEHCALIRTVVEQAAGRIPVIAGTGANSTSEAIALTRCAKSAGAAYALSVAPYYNKPTQEGLYQHFKAIAEAEDLPLILYNVPGRTVSDISNDTVLRLAAVPGIVGIKDATGSIERATDLILRAPADFALYTGDDASALAFMLLGGQLTRGRELNQQLFGLHRKLFVEANPIPVKWAMAEMGLIGAGIRLPLTPLSLEHHEILRLAMRQAGAL